MSRNKSNIGITLTIIYLSLVTLSFGIYSFIILYISNKDHQTILVNLLGWSATLFATIALLYTFNSWREQKSSEVIANEAKIILNDLSQSLSLSVDLFYSFMSNDMNSYQENKSRLYNLTEKKVKYQLFTLEELIILNNKNKRDDELSNTIHLYLHIYYIFNSKLNYTTENKGVISNDDIFKQIIEAVDNYRNINLKLKSKIAFYALYK